MYAGILNGKVILVENYKREYPPTLSGEKPITVECDSTITVGTKYDYNTGEFYDIVKPPVEPMSETEAMRIEDSLNLKYLVALAVLGLV